MKKIYSLLMLAGVMLAITSCNDDNNAGSQYSRPSAIKIIRANTVFTANEDTGSVVFSAPATAEVILNSSWAKSTVEGNTVKLTVTGNTKLEGRSSVLTIKAGEDSVNVTIQQRGVFYHYGGLQKTFVYNDEERDLHIPITSEGAGQSITSPDWAQANISKTSIDIHLTQNNSGHIRSDYVYFNAGAITDSLLVIQGELKDVLNRDYILMGYDLVKESDSNDPLDHYVFLSCRTELDEQGNPVINFPTNNLKLPATFNPDELSLTIKAGSLMGKMLNKYGIFSAVASSDYLQSFLENDLIYLCASPETNFSITAYLDYTEENHTFGIWGDNNFNDDFIKKATEDETAEFNADMFGIFAFQGEKPEKDKFAGFLNLILEPVIIEADVFGAKPHAIRLSPRKKNPVAMQETVRKAKIYQQYLSKQKVTKSFILR